MEHLQVKKVKTSSVESCLISHFANIPRDLFERQQDELNKKFESFYSQENLKGKLDTLLLTPTVFTTDQQNEAASFFQNFFEKDPKPAHLYEVSTSGGDILFVVLSERDRKVMKPRMERCSQLRYERDKIPRFQIDQVFCLPPNRNALVLGNYYFPSFMKSICKIERETWVDQPEYLLNRVCQNGQSITFHEFGSIGQEKREALEAVVNGSDPIHLLLILIDEREGLRIFLDEVKKLTRGAKPENLAVVTVEQKLYQDAVREAFPKVGYYKSVEEWSPITKELSYDISEGIRKQAFNVDPIRFDIQ